VTFPRLKLAGVTVSVPAVAPTPVNETLSVGLEAFEVIASVEVSVPAVVGANATDKFTLAPAASEYGKLIPLMLNPEPVVLAAESVRLDPPVFESARVWVWLLPIVTVPRFMLAGDADNVPAVTPVPLNETFTVGSDAFELIAKVEVNVPAAVGANPTDKFTLAPAVRVYGNAMPLTLKPEPLTLAVEIVRLDPPVFESITDCVWLLPTVTVPRFKLEAAARYPAAVPVPESATETLTV